MASSSPRDPLRSGTEDIRKRFACDRCHTQKIRCPRKPGQAVCDRCAKAKAECLFSPFRQKKVNEEGPEKDGGKDVNVAAIDGSVKTTDMSHVTSRKRARPSSDANGYLELDGSFDFTTPSPQDTLDFTSSDSGSFSQDWIPTGFSNDLDPSLVSATDLEFGSQASATPYFFGEFPSASKQYPSLLTNGSSQTQIGLDAYLETGSSVPLQSDNASPDSTTEIPRPPVYYSTFTSQLMNPDSPSICVRKLSKLNVELFDHKLSIPPLSIHDPNSIQYNPGIPPCDYSNYVVEDAFRLTQSLIDVYPSFLSTAVRHEESKSISHGFAHSDESTTEPVPCELSKSPLQSTQTISLDHSSILLLISCHLRLIEIYEILFQHMAFCIKQKGVPLTPEQASLTAPQLKIGSYTPPQSAALPMQFLLLVQFATQLSDYASDLTTEIEKPQESTSGTSGEVFASTRAAAQNVRFKAKNMSKDLTFLRGQMLSNGLMA